MNGSLVGVVKLVLLDMVMGRYTRGHVYRLEFAGMGLSCYIEAVIARYGSLASGVDWPTADLDPD